VAFNSHATARQAEVQENYEIEVDRMVDARERRKLEEESQKLAELQLQIETEEKQNVIIAKRVQSREELIKLKREQPSGGRDKQLEASASQLNEKIERVRDNFTKSIGKLEDAIREKKQ
jgi:hypothetical protein